MVTTAASEQDGDGGDSSNSTEHVLQFDWRWSKDIRVRQCSPVTPEVGVTFSVAAKLVRMRDPQDDLMQAVSADDLPGIRAAVAAGADPNARSYEGASILHYACIHGNLEVVRTLLDLGGDPNVRAEPPGDEILDPTALDTVIGARFLMDWEKYDPIYDLLVARGARDSDGEVPDHPA